MRIEAMRWIMRTTETAQVIMRVQQVQQFLVQSIDFGVEFSDRYWDVHCLVMMVDFYDFVTLRMVLVKSDIFSQLRWGTRTVGACSFHGQENYVANFSFEYEVCTRTALIDAHRICKENLPDE